jgi:hypothetical protein
MEPEEALEAARARAAELRAEGIYPPPAPPAPRFSPDPEPDPELAQMTEWALIEPDRREVRSTRRLGAPVTAVKQALLRLLEQYHGQIRFQQTRFNVNLLAQVRLLERRVAELEQQLAERDGES